METARITLRRWKESDAETLFKYASDPDVGPRAGWPVHQSVEESQEVIRKFFLNDSTWAIVLKETESFTNSTYYSQLILPSEWQVFALVLRCIGLAVRESHPLPCVPLLLGCRRHLHFDRCQKPSLH